LKKSLPCLFLFSSFVLTACGGGSNDSGSDVRLLSESTAVMGEADAANDEKLTTTVAAYRRTSTQPTTTTGTTSPSGTTIDARLSCGQPNFQQDILNRVNQARAAGRTCGTTRYNAVPALKWNSNLFNAAAAHSTDMAANNYFSHTGLDGRNAGQRITGAGYAWRSYGENIAAGQFTVQSVVDGWLASPGHCANIMSANVTEMATACVASSTSRYKTYWTMDLARPQ